MKRASSTLIGKRLGLLAAALLVAANFCIAADNPKDTKQLEEPTLENINSILDHAIGVNRRMVATIKDLQLWYEQSPLGLTNPDAIALRKKFCHDSTGSEGEPFFSNDHLLAVEGAKPKDDGRFKKTLMATMGHPEVSEKLDRIKKLLDEYKSGFNELEGMGFNCIGAK